MRGNDLIYFEHEIFIGLADGAIFGLGDESCMEINAYACILYFSAGYESIRAIHQFRKALSGMRRLPFYNPVFRFAHHHVQLIIRWVCDLFRMFSLICLHSSYPFMCGIITSLMIISGCERLITFKASTPSLAVSICLKSVSSASRRKLIHICIIIYDQYRVVIGWESICLWLLHCAFVGNQFI